MIRTEHEGHLMLHGAQAMSNAQYHADTSRISKSGLDLIAKSPRHYWQAKLSPNKEPQRETEALIMGRAVHLAVLEPYLFRMEFAIEPDLNLRTNHGKADYQTWLENIGGKSVISRDQYDTCMRVRDSVFEHPAASSLLATGFAEQTWFWTDQETGVACKSRTDFITPDKIVVDVKSTEDASADAFGRSAAKYRYHVQAAYYLDGLVNNAYVPDSFVFIAVEKKPPYGVAVYHIGNNAVESGRTTYRRDLATYKESLLTQKWRGYSDEIVPLHFPSYAL